MSEMSERPRLFPVLARDNNDRPIKAAIPWAVAEAMRSQCEQMCGGQTLERIAQRGGMSWRELAHALAGVDFGVLKCDDLTAQYMVAGASHIIARQATPRAPLKRRL